MGPRRRGAPAGEAGLLPEACGRAARGALVWAGAAGRERAAEERCLVTAGRASLWPLGGGPPIEIREGDWVTFRRGFLCTWVVHEAIAKKYSYFDAAGTEC